MAKKNANTRGNMQREVRVADDHGDQKEDGRAPRAQETREAEVVHEAYGDHWEQPLTLDTSNIPARPGFVQRWVRTKVNGTDDPNNVVRKYNQGWRPRMADSVPKGIYAPEIKYRDQNVIGIDGMNLMERPENIHDAHARRNRQATKDQQRAVDESMFRVHEPNSGFGRPQRAGKSQVTRGRSVKVADDN